RNPLTSSSVPSPVCWPYQSVRYLSVWPPNPEVIFIAGGQGSGPVMVPDASWTVYRQPNPNQYGYNPNEEHAFRYSAPPPLLKLRVSTSALMITKGGSMPVNVSLVGDPAFAPQSPVTVTAAGARNGDANIYVMFPTNASEQSLVFAPTNWQTPQTLVFAATAAIDTGSNSFVIRAEGGVVSQTTVDVLEVDTNQLKLVVDSLAFDLTENASKAVKVRLTQAPQSPVTVATSNRASPGDSPILRVESGATLVFDS